MSDSQRANAGRQAAAESRLCGRRSSRGFTLLELMFTAGIFAVIMAFAVPMIANTRATLRLSGDARQLSNSIAVAKIRGASQFSKARVYADLGARTSRVEIYNKNANTWTQVGAAMTLSSGVNYGFGAIGNAPPNTQPAIGQATACINTATPPVAVVNTACIVFNSRGVPVNAAGAPVADGALYITDATNVYGITVSSSGMSRLWRARPVVNTAWLQQ